MTRRPALARSLVVAGSVCTIALTGCAYVEYRRTYNLSVQVPESERVPLSDTLDRFFVGRGLVLKRKYRDVYPRNVLVSAFEISRTREDDRRYPLLFVITSDSGSVQLVQSEYYFESKRQPEDLVSAAKPELLQAIATALGGKPDLVYDPGDRDGKSR